MIKEICKNTKLASNQFSSVTTENKNKILIAIKEQILAKKEEILSENKRDIAIAIANGQNSAFVDRLTLTDARILTMANGIDAVVNLQDPINEIVEEYDMPSGLHIIRKRVPLGVIGIIFEARPNVAVDASVLCIKSGNGVVLRGSKDAAYSNTILVEIMHTAIKLCGFDPNLVANIVGADREISKEMLKQFGLIDVIIPRGGNSLKTFVLENATMPVIASAGGNCHLYVAPSADFKMAIDIILNAKVQRPSVCNAVETLLVHKDIADKFLPKCLAELEKNKVEIRGTEEVKKIYSNTNIINEEEFFEEYSQLIIKVDVVTDTTSAINHINHYNTSHSDGIITMDKLESDRFITEVDASVVYVNTSTRFTDGFELGLGAEIGISTQKLHVRGPIGLKELTSVKYVVDSNGVIRK